MYSRTYWSIEDWNTFYAAHELPTSSREAWSENRSPPPFNTSQEGKSPKFFVLYDNVFRVNREIIPSKRVNIIFLTLLPYPYFTISVYKPFIYHVVNENITETCFSRPYTLLVFLIIERKWNRTSSYPVLVAAK